ncbi:MAG: DUF2520 domain-containing protein [Saprospiraceae bacterium]
MTPNSKIVIIGAGRVAGHLGKRLTAKGLNVVQVLNRSAGPAQMLGGALQVPWSDQWSELRRDADWLLLAVRDDAIGETAAALAPYCPNALVTHTSGATPSTVLSPYFRRFGVFYPLQSFSVERTPVWSGLPVCVEAALPADLVFLQKMARQLGGKAWVVNDEQRAKLHVAAVFANNFTNHCLTIAEALLQEQGLPFEMLHPLLTETVAKALAFSPAQVQTGPAQRGDQATLHQHLALLAAHPDWQALYAALSRSIQNDPHS